MCLMTTLKRYAKKISEIGKYTKASIHFFSGIKILIIRNAEEVTFIYSGA